MISGVESTVNKQKEDLKANMDIYLFIRWHHTLLLTLLVLNVSLFFFHLSHYIDEKSGQPAPKTVSVLRKYTQGCRDLQAETSSSGLHQGIEGCFSKEWWLFLERQTKRRGHTTRTQEP